MYHASRSLAPNDVLISGGLKIVALVPGGAHGVLSKSNFPSRDAYAESLGYTLDVRSRFNESCPCSRSSFHNCAGKSLSVVHKPEIKWSLKVWIALSAALNLRLCGSTSCSLIFSFYRYVLIVLDATLSNIFKFGLYPQIVRYLLTLGRL